MEWTDQALVLRMGAFRESDIWLKLLCREHGLLTLFAFGGSRSRRRFCGCLDVLNSLHCRVRSSKDGRFLNLEEAALLQGPRLLRRNWQRMGLAANCLRFVEAMGVGEDAATEAFLLVEDLRAVLEAEKAPPVLLPLYFRLRLAGALGFAPNLGQCGRCGRDISEDALFVVDEGQLRCPSCRSSRFELERYGVEIPAQGLDLLRHVQQSFPSGWPGGELSPPVRRACARAIDGFVQYHLGLAWDGNYFRRV